MMSTLLPMSRRIASLWKVSASMWSGTLKDAAWHDTLLSLPTRIVLLMRYLRRPMR